MGTEPLGEPSEEQPQERVKPTGARHGGPRIAVEEVLATATAGPTPVRESTAAGGRRAPGRPKASRNRRLASWYTVSKARELFPERTRR